MYARAAGATTDRPEFQKCLKKLSKGDSLTVWKLDRLGRSLRDLITVLDDFKERGIKFRSLTENIATETPTGPRYVANDRHSSGTGTLPDQGTHSGRHRGGPGERRAIWTKEEA